jgi:Phage integrase family
LDFDIDPHGELAVCRTAHRADRSDELKSRTIAAAVLIATLLSSTRRRPCWPGRGVLANVRDQERLHPLPVAALRLLALTGLRREEACGLRWREIDWSSNCLRLDQTMTGKSTRPIGKAAMHLLSTLPRGQSEWCSPGRAGTEKADLKKRIAMLFDAAGLRDVRSHDLRRTFATIAADEGYSDATIAELLGHARRGVTARHYIRPPDAALVAAADRVAARIAAALDRRQDVEVIDLREAARRDPLTIDGHPCPPESGKWPKISAVRSKRAASIIRTCKTHEIVSIARLAVVARVFDQTVAIDEAFIISNFFGA